AVVRQGLSGIDQQLQALSKAMQSRIERNAIAVLPEQLLRCRCCLVCSKGIAISAVRQVRRGAAREAGSDVADDLRGLPGHEPGVPVTEAFERGAEPVRRAALSQQTQPDGALRPEIGHVKHHACAFEATEQDPCKAEKQRRTLDEKIVRRVEVDAAE